MINYLFNINFTTTNTDSALSTPSISFRSVESTRSCTLSPLDPPFPIFLLPTIASVSSRNIIAGADALAFWNVVRTTFSESPTKGEYNCAPLIDKNATLVEEAITFTKVVLLQPGGPYSKMPLGGFNPSFLNESLYNSGHSTACFNLYQIKTLLHIPQHSC